MDKSKLKKFAQYARRTLIEIIGTKLAFVLANDSAARREFPSAVKELEEEIRNTSEERTIEKVAYIWFNRFCALRFMDVNRYTRIGILSPLEGQFQPEILSEAKKGYIDEELVPEKIREKICGLLNGTLPSRDPQNEAYSQLIVSVCNYYHRIMPFLFQKISDYTELIIPDDLLSGNSIPTYVREALTPNACEDVEVIGWLYQFYISEKKDEVFEGLKKNKKITPENIPAATQLFTPHYIVRYLVENSLGRLWLLNHPDSKIIDRMDYYVPPVDKETDFLKISSPEAIKICDPACGSGHMLTYSFDLLYTIYEEEGYEPTEIPTKILENNLYGIEIDERAGELAAFALMMKARTYDKRIFERLNSSETQLEPNICVLRNIHFESDELKNYSKEIGTDLLVGKALETLHQFEDADNFGSLIRPIMCKTGELLRKIDEKTISGDLFLQNTHKNVKAALTQADYLSSKYHIVITNPPYMGAKGMNSRLSVWSKVNFPESKSNLFAMFIMRNLRLAHERGTVAMITMQSWMFLSSFKGLREKVLSQSSILTLAHLGARAFDSIGGEIVSTTAFVIGTSYNPDLKGAYLRLIDGNNEAEKDSELINNRFNPFYVPIHDFRKIPGSPIAYWLHDYDIFVQNELLGKVLDVKVGLQTGNNERFLRQWHEVGVLSIGFKKSSKIEAQISELKWFPYNKGGDWRKWYGNLEYIVDWYNDGIEIRNYKDPHGKLRSRPQNTDYYFREGITWADITTSNFAARYAAVGSIFDVKGSSGFAKAFNLNFILGLMNSKPMLYFMLILNPTSTFQVGDIARVPFIRLDDKNEKCTINVERSAAIANSDWDSYETSWDFTSLPLLQSEYRKPSLHGTYDSLSSHWNEMTLEMKRLEEENNDIFIKAYGLEDELDKKVPLEEITLTCNPRYRYKKKKATDEDLDVLLLKDTMEEFISYAVGCMLGRYSLDKPSLILANQGETVEDYLKQIPDPSYPPDEDNVIPILEANWFTDDITERFFNFLRVTFGEENYKQNLEFIEDALGKDIRKYFLKDFYKDHVKRYKKRPIYWMFSSPRSSFNVLIYMHRYRPDTISVILNEYLREFRVKITARKDNLEQVSISASTSSAEKTKALKEIEKLKLMIRELDEYESDVLFPLATKQIEIDLDDGVKVNYNKFGEALKPISGLTGK